MFNEFSSSAIESISTNDAGQLVVTFTGGRQYTYAVEDINAFAVEFNAAVSKGRYLNQQIQAESGATSLQTVAVWNLD